MALSRSRLLLVWTTLPIAVLLSYLWYKKKRTEVQSDPKPITCKGELKSLQEELQEAEASNTEPSLTKKPFSRSLSGIDSAPIDIIFPPELKSAKSAQIIISDEDLDLEIEKIRSMKNSTELFSSKNKTNEKVVNVLQSQLSVKEQLVIEKPILKVASPKVAGSFKKSNVCIKVKNCIPEENTPKTEMAQTDIVTVSSIEKKIGSLKVDSHEQQKPKSEPTTAAITDNDIQRQSTERDSANPSPVDVMLASPSLSCISDSHSEGSSDSGKGCSEVATPPSRTPAGAGSVAGDVSLPTIYEFVIPQLHVGKLIGRQGTFVIQIKIKTRAHIIIKNHPDDAKLKVCLIEGTPTEIEQALEMIRDRFPAKRYSDITLEQVAIPPLVSTVPLMPEQLYLKLVEGINNDTIVSCMVAPNHLFLQQPTHPSFPNLSMLSDCMNVCYNDDNSPMLPDPIPENSLCAAYSLGAWYRAIVLSTEKDTDTSHLKFLDYGGYANVKNSDLRQIRADFVLLPFQAAECVLYNVKPVGGDDAQWSNDAFSLVADLTKGSIVYTQIAEYTEDEIPLVLIYVVLGPQQIIFLNQELVNRGLAEWVDNHQTVVNGRCTALIS